MQGRQGGRKAITPKNLQNEGSRDPSPGRGSRCRWEGGDDPLDNLVRRQRKIDDQRSLVGLGWFEGGQLVVQQNYGHKVACPGLKTAANQARRARKVNQPQARGSHPKSVSIGPFEGRAGNDHALAVHGRAGDFACHGLEPWSPIRVGQRPAEPHFPNVFSRMQVIGIEKRHPESVCQKPADHSLSGARNPHQEEW